MDWWMWILAGAAALAVGFVVWLFVMDGLASRAAASRRAVAGRQPTAERQIQAVVQDTIARMFEAARRLP